MRTSFLKYGFLFPEDIVRQGVGVEIIREGRTQKPYNKVKPEAF